MKTFRFWGLRALPAGNCPPIGTTAFVARWLSVLVALMLMFSVKVSFAQQVLVSSRAVAGSVPSINQPQSFSFSLPKPGMVVLNVVATLTEGDLRPAVTVVDAKGNVVLSSAYGGRVVRLWRENMPAGNYRVIVGSVYQWGNGPFSIQFVRGGAPVERGTLESSKPSLSPLGFGDLDTYQFSATKGQTVMVSSVGRAGEIYPQIWVIDSQNQLVAQPSVLNRVSAADFVVKNSGDHTVVVFDSHIVATGSYELELVQAAQPTKFGELLAHELRQGELRVGSMNTYAISAVAGESLVLSAVPQPGNQNLALRLRLLDASGTLIASWTRLNDVTRGHVRVSRGGLLTVVVDDQYRGGSGSYALRLLRAPGSANQGELIAGGGRVVMVSKGGIESFQAIFAKGEQIDLTVDGQQFQPQLQIFAPDGRRLNLLGNGLQTLNARFTADQDGRYIFAIDANYAGSTGGAKVSLKPVRPKLSYVAMGDSYSSGEGVKPYRDSQDNFTPSSGCHRSIYAYPSLLQLPNRSTPISQDKAWAFDFIACSGAVAANILTEPRYGEPPQLTPSNAVDAGRNLVTISIGGNDAQFVPIIALCLAHADCPRLKPFERITGLTLGQLGEAWLEVVRFRAFTTYRQIRAATPNATVVALGYPILLEGRECPSLMFPPIQNGLQISAAEQVWLRAYNQRLNNVLSAAAAAAGVHFVSLESAFAGRGICSVTVPWINGIVLLPSNHKASFHPNLLGQAAYAAAIKAYLGGKSSGWPLGYFTSGLPRNPLPGIPLLEPKGPALPSIDELSVTLPASPESCRNLAQVAVVAEDIKLSGKGFAPGEAVELSLNVGEQRTSLGSARAKNDGSLDIQVKIPAGTPSSRWGFMRAEADGPARAGIILQSAVKLVLSKTADLNGNNTPDICEP